MAEPETKTLKEVIPQEFHDRGYLKDLLDKPQGPEAFADVFKKLDGAESLIGRKIGIPGADAKPDEIEKFYSSLRPGKVEDYDLKGLGEKPDEEFVKMLRTAAHKRGLSKVQLSGFTEDLSAFFKGRSDQATTKQKEQDTAFDDIVAKAFGKDEEVILERANAAIKEHTPESLKPYLDKISNENLAVMAGVINAVLVKYVPEDDLKGKGKGGSGGSAPTVEDLNKEAIALQSSDAWKDFRHPEHQKTVDRVQEIYKNWPKK